ncbi:hypothetical protein BJY16_007331 [Actinoplanes octamycinicus]|uniref:Uncharacterized protein n=1 Tax=Actinoplanes octamycinicus TaxID=135948 RepID=A0A7W7H576_9ACTN|nr:hypothetical protein [Actinoplanes octamycinicus]
MTEERFDEKRLLQALSIYVGQPGALGLWRG